MDVAGTRREVVGVIEVCTRTTWPSWRNARANACARCQSPHRGATFSDGAAIVRAMRNRPPGQRRGLAHERRPVSFDVGAPRLGVRRERPCERRDRPHGPMVDHDRVRHRDDPAAPRPQPPAQLEHSHVGVLERGKPTHGLQRPAVDDETRGRSPRNAQGHTADRGAPPRGPGGDSRRVIVDGEIEAELANARRRGESPAAAARVHHLWCGRDGPAVHFRGEPRHPSRRQWFGRRQDEARRARDQSARRPRAWLGVDDLDTNVVPRRRGERGDLFEKLCPPFLRAGVRHGAVNAQCCGLPGVARHRGQGSGPPMRPERGSRTAHAHAPPAATTPGTLIKTVPRRRATDPSRQLRRRRRIGEWSPGEDRPLTGNRNVPGRHDDAPTTIA